MDPAHDIYQLALSSDEIEDVFGQDKKIQAERTKEGTLVFKGWQDGVRNMLLSINGTTDPKELIRQLGGMILSAYEESRFIDNYDIYDCLMNYWNEKLQDDVYAIKAYGYETAREIEYQYSQKKTKDENGETVFVDDKSRVKSFDGALIPRSIVEREYFADEIAVIESLTEKRDQLDAEMEEIREEETGEDGFLKEVLTDVGELPKGNLIKRINELEGKKKSAEVDALTSLLSFFDTNKNDMDGIIKEPPSIEKYGIRIKNGTLSKAKIKSAIKVAAETAVMPEAYQDEYDALLSYQSKLDEQDSVNKQIKQAQKELDDKVQTKYGELSVEEIHHLLFDEKWMSRMSMDINSEIDRILNVYAARVVMIAKRYEHTLGEIEDKTAKSKEAVRKALERMGYTW